VLPTAYQSVAYADTPKGGTLAVLGHGYDIFRDKANGCINVVLQP
jgi:hypothetical protein